MAITVHDTDTYVIKVSGLTQNQSHTLTVNNGGAIAQYPIDANGYVLSQSGNSLAGAAGLSFSESFKVDGQAVSVNGLPAGTPVLFSVVSSASAPQPGAKVSCSTAGPTSGCSSSHYHCQANNVYWSSCSPITVASQGAYTYNSACTYNGGQDLGAAAAIPSGACLAGGGTQP